MLTIDQLKEYAPDTNPFYSGNGYIKLRSTNGVYRFYCEEVVKRVVDRVHTHMQTYTAMIMKGTLRHIIYDVTPVEYETDYRLIQGPCARGCMPPTVHENVITSEKSVCDITEGNLYKYNLNDPHNVRLGTPKVITLKTNIIARCTDDPAFVIDKRIPHIDPWDAPKPTMDYWEIIEYILSD